MDVQIGVYLRAAKALGHESHAVGYDVLRRPELRPQMPTPVELRKYTKPTKNDPVSRLYANQRAEDETPEAFGSRCLEAIKSDPEKYYQRRMLVRLENEHNESAADIWQTTQAMREARRLRIFPRNPDACIQWSRECEFLNVCCGESAIDDPMLFRKSESVNEELDLVEELDRVRVTQSSIRAYRSCPRKYHYRYMLGMRPLVLAEPMRSGTSVHRAIEALRRGEDLQSALEKLDADDAYARAKEQSMIIGYVARWGAPTGIVEVEKTFEVELVNPSTGASSKTFRMAGKFDAIFNGEEREFLRN